MNNAVKNILIVDDEQETVEQIKRLLRLHFECLLDVAYNGKEALDKMRVKDYDLVILDLLVPKLNGIEVCEFMIRDEQLKLIPVLLISILPLNSEDFQKSLSKFKEFATVRGVLEKPFLDQDLLIKVKKIIYA